MSWQPLGPTWWPDHKMNICHQVIVEHHCISTNRGNVLICSTRCICANQRNQTSEHLKVTHNRTKSRLNFVLSYIIYHVWGKKQSLEGQRGVKKITKTFQKVEISQMSTTTHKQHCCLQPATFLFTLFTLQTAALYGKHTKIFSITRTLFFFSCRQNCFTQGINE